MGRTLHNELEGLAGHSAFAPVTCDQSFASTITPSSFSRLVTYAARNSDPIAWPMDWDIDLASEEDGSRGASGTTCACITLAALPSRSGVEAKPPSGTEKRAEIACSSRSGLVSSRLTPLIDFTSA